MDEVGIEHRLTAVEKLAGDTAEHLAALEKRQDDLDQLTSAVAVFAKEQEHIQADVKEIKADVKALTEKPGRRWEGLVDKLLYAAAGAVRAWQVGGGLRPPERRRA